MTQIDGLRVAIVRKPVKRRDVCVGARASWATGWGDGVVAGVGAKVEGVRKHLAKENGHFISDLLVFFGAENGSEILRHGGKGEAEADADHPTNDTAANSQN